MNASTQTQNWILEFVLLLKQKTENWHLIMLVPNIEGKHHTCRIYCVRSTASFFSWTSRVSLSSTVIILISPRRTSLMPRGRFRTQTLIFSISFQGFSFSEVFWLIYKWALIFNNTIKLLKRSKYQYILLHIRCNTRTHTYTHDMLHTEVLTLSSFIRYKSSWLLLSPSLLHPTQKQVSCFLSIQLLLYIYCFLDHSI